MVHSTADIIINAEPQRSSTEKLTKQFVLKAHLAYFYTKYAHIYFFVISSHLIGLAIRFLLIQTYCFIRMRI